MVNLKTICGFVLATVMGPVESFEGMEGIAVLSLENSRGIKKRKLDPREKVGKLQLITQIF